MLSALINLITKILRLFSSICLPTCVPNERCMKADAHSTPMAEDMRHLRT